MNNIVKTSLLTMALGVAVCSANANAAIATHQTWSNAVNYCGAFTPGVSNTLRNRVIGVENVGSAPLAVSCNYASFYNGAPCNSSLHTVNLYFTNNSSIAVDVTCTMLAGTSGSINSGSSYAVTKTVSIGAGAPGTIGWTVADNPTAGAVDLGNLMVGVNCNLPISVVLSATNLRWAADNGVEPPAP